jgi:hypothetical protein
VLPPVGHPEHTDSDGLGGWRSSPFQLKGVPSMSKQSMPWWMWVVAVLGFVAIVAFGFMNGAGMLKH